MPTLPDHLAGNLGSALPISNDWMPDCFFVAPTSPAPDNRLTLIGGIRVFRPTVQSCVIDRYAGQSFHLLRRCACGPSGTVARLKVRCRKELLRRIHLGQLAALDQVELGKSQIIRPPDDSAAILLRNDLREHRANCLSRHLDAPSGRGLRRLPAVATLATKLRRPAAPRA